MSDEAVAQEPLAEGERTHPLGLLIGFITGLPQLFFPMIAVVFGSGSRNRPELIPFVILGVMLVSLLFRWIGWMRFRFHLGEDDIRIERGLLNRTVRSIPYDRIQDVSIEQKPLARLFDLGEVKFESGGGEGEDAKLSFVGMERAEALRETIRACKAEGGLAALEEVAEEKPPVFAMDSKRLMTLGFYSFSLVIFAVLGGLAQQFDFLLPYDWWDFKHWIGMAEERGVSIDRIGAGAGIVGALFALAALVALGIASGVIRTFLREHGFRLDRTAKGFRRRRGLLTKTDVVMPAARVQAASIVTGPIRKLSGWYALKFVSLAQDSKEETDFVAAPLAKLAEIWPIAAETGLTAPDVDTPFRKSRFLWWASGLIGLGLAMVVAMFAMMVFADAPFRLAGWTLLVPLLFLPIVWMEWRHYGDLLDAEQLYLHQGWWREKLDIARQINVQSAEIVQGPIARLLGLSTLHFGLPGGSLAFSALPLAEARAIRDAVMDRVAPVDFSALNQRG